MRENIASMGQSKPEILVPLGTPPPAGAQWLLPDQHAEWDAFVARHPMGLVYHLSAWKQVLEEAFPHITGRFLVSRSGIDNTIQSGLPVYAVTSWLLGRRISSVPFATICDPLISSADEINQLLPELERLRRRAHSRVIQIRSGKTAPLLATAGLAGSSAYKHHHLSLQPDTDRLFRSFSKSSIQQKALKAERDGVVVEQWEPRDGLEICHAILAENRARLALPVLPYGFFQAMERWLWPKHLAIFVAVRRGTPVACHIILRFKDVWISEHSGNTDDAGSGVNQLLYWETMKHAKAQGARTFSFGRTSVLNEGLLAYKRRWNPVEEDLSEFTWAATGRHRLSDATAGKREDSAAYKVVRSMLSRAPKPLYHILGSYCYRHLG